MIGSIGPRFLSAGFLVFDGGLLVISDSVSFVGGSVKHQHIIHKTTTVKCKQHQWYFEQNVWEVSAPWLAALSRAVTEF